MEGEAVTQATKTPRGLRNNNPFNIRKTDIQWRGEAPGADSEFESFDTPEAGIRAGLRNMSTHQQKYGANSLAQLLQRHAPPVENDTDAYIQAVAQNTGLQPDAPVDLGNPEVAFKLADAIVRQENGVPLPAETVRGGVENFLGASPSMPTTEYMPKSARRVAPTPSAEYMPKSARRITNEPPETQTNPTGWQRDPETGQLFIQAPEVTDAFTEGRGLESLGLNIAGGVRDAVVGLLGTGADLGQAYFQMTPAESEEPEMAYSERINRAIPEVRADDVTGNIVQGISQYAPMGVSAGNLVTKGVSGLPALAKGASSGLGKLLQTVGTGAAGLTGAAVSDAAVTVPEEASTIGDLFNGVPLLGATAINPDDSALMKRFKVGAETLPVGAVVGTGMAAAKKGYRGIKNFREALRPLDETAAADEVARYLQEKVVNNEVALQNIENAAQAYEGTGFKPTLGQASRDPGLLGVEQGAAVQNNPLSMRRQANVEHAASLLGEVGQRSQPQGQAEQALKSLAATEQAGVLDPIAQRLGAFETALEDLKVQIGEFANRAANPGVGMDNAAGAMDQQIQEAFDRVSAEREALYNIDPEGAAKRSAGDFLQRIESIRRDLGDLPSDFPETRVKTILQDFQPEGEISAKQLKNIRAGVSREGQAAFSATGQPIPASPAKLGYLNQIKQAIDEEMARIGEAYPEVAAKKQMADAFQKEQYSPRFKEGPGADWLQETRSPGGRVKTATAAKFVKSGEANGAKEAAAQYNTITAGQPGATPALRDFMREKIAREVGSPQGLKGKQLEAWSGRFDSFKQKYASALGEFPEVRKEIYEMANRAKAGAKQTGQLENDIAATIKEKGISENEFATTAAGKILKSDTPQVTMSQLLDSKDIEKEVGGFLALAAKDKTGASTQGLADLYNEALHSRFSLDTKTTSGDQLKASATKIIGYFSDPQYGAARRAATAKMHSAGSPAKAKQLERLMLEMDDISRFAQSTPGSQTAALGAQTKETDNLFVDLAGVLHPMGPLAGRSRSRSFINILNRVLGRNEGSPENIAAQLLINAYLDPNGLGKDLLTRKLSSEMAPETEKFLKSYISNNIFGGGERRKEQNKKRNK